MVKLSEMPEKARSMIVDQDLPDFGPTDCVDGKPLSERKIAIVTTAGLHRASDKHFTPGAGEYRIIPSDTDIETLVMTHVSTNFDRTGFLQDVNLVFPADRLREMADDGTVGSVADYHYAFMGATPPGAMEAVARDLAGVLKNDGVDGVVLAGV